MLLINLLVTYILSIPNTIQTFFELLINDQISINTFEWIESAIENNNCFQIIPDKPKTSLFVLLHFSHPELRIQYFFKIKTLQIYEYQGMFWCSKFMDPYNRLTMLLYIKKILLDLKLNEESNIGIDVFADELNSNSNLVRNEEELNFVRDLVNLINEKNFNIKNVDYHIKKSIKQPEEIVNISLSNKSSFIALIPSTVEILDLLIYKDIECRKVVNRYTDDDLKNKKFNNNNDAQFLCDYIFYKLSTDLANLKYFLDFIFNTPIKFDYEEVDFYSTTLKNILASKNFCLNVRTNTQILEFLTQLEYPKFKQIYSNDTVDRLSEFINEKFRYLDKNTYNEFEDFCQKILIVLYNNFKCFFVLKFQIILQEKEQRNPLHEKVIRLLRRIYSILEQKVIIVKNMFNAQEKQSNINWRIKGLRTNYFIQSSDLKYINKIKPKLKTTKVISKSLYDLVKINE